MPATLIALCSPSLRERYVPTALGRRLYFRQALSQIINLLREVEPDTALLVFQCSNWDRHAPAWLLEPGWSPALPGGHWIYEMDI